MLRLRHVLLFAVILLLTSALFVPTYIAAEDRSAGCDTLNNFSGGGANTNTIVSIDAGEIIRIKIMGEGTGTYNLTIDAVNVATANFGTQIIYEFAAAGQFSVGVEMTVLTGTATFEMDCVGVDGSFEEEDAKGPFTLCHLPPGNPDAAKTITVGSKNALEAHLSNHNDYEGECTAEDQSNYEDPGGNISIFVLDDTGDAGIVQIYGNCSSGSCLEVAVIDITILRIRFLEVGVVIGNPAPSETPVPDDDSDDSNDDDDDTTDNPDDLSGVEYPSVVFDSTPGDGWYVVVFYLHDDTFNPDEKILQVNVYNNGVIENDSLLIFLGADGTIIRFASHDYWLGN